MGASDTFVDFLREQLGSLGTITTRRMFGKTGVFCDGVMLGIVVADSLYFRVDEHTRAAFKEAEASPPLSYSKKGKIIDLAFWQAPERLFDDPEEFLSWARIALSTAQRVASKRDLARRLQMKERRR